MQIKDRKRKGRFTSISENFVVFCYTVINSIVSTMYQYFYVEDDLKIFLYILFYRSLTSILRQMETKWMNFWLLV